MCNPFVSSLGVASGQSQRFFQRKIRYNSRPEEKRNRFAQLFREVTCNHRLTQTPRRHRRSSCESPSCRLTTTRTTRQCIRRGFPAARNSYLTYNNRDTRYDDQTVDFLFLFWGRRNPPPLSFRKLPVAGVVQFSGPSLLDLVDIN